MKKLVFTILSLAFATGLAAQTGQEELSVRYNQYGVAVDRNPLSAEERGGILVFEDAKQTYKFWLDLRVQLDGAYFFGQNPDYDPIGNGIKTRRIRMAFKAQVTPDWYAEIDTDFASGAFELKDAIIRYDGLCNASFSLGNMKEDFSMSEVTTSRYLSFMERPAVVAAFAPSRHIGIDVNYQKNWFYMSGGVFFQTVDALITAENVEANNKDEGRTSGPDYLTRMVFNPFWRHHRTDYYGLHIGGGAVYRLPKTDGAILDYKTTRYNARNTTNINRKKYTDTDVLQDFQHEFLFNGEAAFWYKGLRMQGEYISSNVWANKNVYRFGGWYGEIGHTLFGGKQRYDDSGAKFTQPTRGRHWGDIELMARYDYINLTDKNVYGGSAEHYTFGVNYYINNNVKLVLNYMFVNNDRYANGRGKLMVGHDATGKPTSNYRTITETGGKAGVDYNMLGCRIELDF